MRHQVGHSGKSFQGNDLVVESPVTLITAVEDLVHNAAENCVLHCGKNKPEKEGILRSRDKTLIVANPLRTYLTLSGSVATVTCEYIVDLQGYAYC